MLRAQVPTVGSQALKCQVGQPRFRLGCHPHHSVPAAAPLGLCLRASHQPAASEGPLEKDRVQASCARWGTQSCGVSTNAGGKCPGGCPPGKHLTQFPLIKIQVHKHQSWREQVAPWGPAIRPRRPTQGMSGQEDGVGGHPLGDTARPPDSPQTWGHLRPG